MASLVLREGPLNGQRIIGYNGLHFVTDEGSRLFISPWQEIEESPELVGDLCLEMML
jgi:hypothetical protein